MRVSVNVYEKMSEEAVEKFFVLKRYREPTNSYTRGSEVICVTSVLGNRLREAYIKKNNPQHRTPSQDKFSITDLKEEILTGTKHYKFTFIVKGVAWQDDKNAAEELYFSNDPLSSTEIDLRQLDNFIKEQMKTFTSSSIYLYPNLGETKSEDTHDTNAIKQEIAVFKKLLEDYLASLRKLATKKAGVLAPICLQDKINLEAALAHINEELGSLNPDAHKVVELQQIIERHIQSVVNAINAYITALSNGKAQKYYQHELNFWQEKGWIKYGTKMIPKVTEKMFKDVLTDLAKNQAASAFKGPH